MKNIINEERRLKSYLKNHVSLNIETMIKFLITGMVAVSLTACGGGSGNSTNPIPPVVDPEEPKPELPIKPVETINKINQTHEVSNKDVIIQGSVKGDGSTSNFVGIKAINSAIESKATIDISGEGAVGLYGTTSGVRATTSPEVINSGNIFITGKNAIGLKVDNGVKGVNNGSISMRSSVEDKSEIIEENIVNEGSEWKEKKIYTKTYGTVIGLNAENKSLAVNNREIKITGKGIGIKTDNSAGINNGNIEGISEKVEHKVTESGYKNRIVQGYTKVVGILGENNSKIENGAKGNIKLTGEAIGIKVKNSEVVNNGTINLIAKEEKLKFTNLNENLNTERIDWSEIIGIKGDNSIISNNGEIRLTNDGQGIKTYNNSKVINEKDGKIVINAGTKGSNGKDVNWRYHVNGIELSKNSTGENRGTIIITGDTENKGVSLDKTSNFVNKGTIEVESLSGKFANGISESAGDGTTLGNLITNEGTIKVSYSDKNRPENVPLGYATGISTSKVLNKGTIIVKSDSEGMGIRGSEIENDLSGNIDISGTGNLYGIKGKGKAINKGRITGTGREVYGIEGDNVLNEGSVILKSVDNAEGINDIENSQSQQNIKIVNKGNLEIESNTYAKGIAVYKGEQVDITNDGKISVSSTGETEPSQSTGISAKGNSGMIINNSTGIIKVLSKKEAYGVKSVGVNIINNGEIITEVNDGLASTGISVLNTKSVENNGVINVTMNSIEGNGIGIKANSMFSPNSNREIINSKTGKIIVSGDNVVGIQAINPLDNIAEEDKISIINDGLIAINGKDSTLEISTGIQAFNYAGQVNKGLIINNGKIEVESLDTARGIDSYGNDVVNNGIISVKGNIFSSGIRVQAKGATATNNGTINVDGEWAFGMYAGMDSTAINSEKGIINVSATAEGGMHASGRNSKVVNKGTINIAKRDGLDESNKDNIALKASDGGVIENTGTINIEGNLNLGTSNAGRYMIGTTKNGTYGKISAKNVSIDGEVMVSTEITKNEYKNQYTMQNIIDAENIILGDNFNFTSNSLLYDAKSLTDIWGNLDATLTRNNKTLADFTNGYLTSVANIFGKYQTEETFKMLSQDAKEVINAIDTSSKNTIDNSLNSLTPTIYSNLGRQLLEISETFKDQDIIAIDSLGDNTYNFTFIGEYKDIDSRNNIEGYKSKLSGFVGAMNLGNQVFGSIGYGYNGINYKENGKGNIQTIHLGVNKFAKYEKLDFKLGLGGEYNFHENKRDIDLLNRKAELKFNSYGIRATGEVSKAIGEEIFIKPYLGLDLAYMKYDSFTESDAKSLNAEIESENYLSILPKIGLLVGEKIGKLDVFAKVEYSYELGSMDKEQEFSYKGFDGKGKLPKDTLESGTTGLEAGINYEINNFTLGTSAGKNFGRRDNSFAKLSLGYRF